MLANFPKATWRAYREWWQERETRADATTDALGKTCEDLCARVKASIGEGDLSRQLESFFSGGTMLRRARDTVATVEVDDELRRDILAFVEGFVDDASYSRHDDILEHVRAALLLANAPTSFWTYAMEQAVDVINRTTGPPHSTKSSFETVLGAKPKVMSILPFGCRAYAVKSTPAQSKTRIEP